MNAASSATAPVFMSFIPQGLHSLPQPAVIPLLRAQAADLPGDSPEGSPDDLPVFESEFARYRRRTIQLLRRYFRASIEVGRLPALLGREYFPGRVSSRRPCSFEDQIIFTHDLDRCLERLRLPSRQAIATVILERYSMEEAADLLGWGRMTIFRVLPEAIDELSEILIRLRLMKPDIGHEVAPQAPLRQASGPGGNAKNIVNRPRRLQ